MWTIKVILIYIPVRSASGGLHGQSPSCISLTYGNGYFISGGRVVDYMSHQKRKM